MTHLFAILVALAFFHEVFLGCKCYCGNCCNTGNCCEPCQRSVTGRMKAFIDFFKFTGLLLGAIIVSSLLVWHPWTYNSKATLLEQPAKMRRLPGPATAAQPVSQARPTAAALDRELQASQEREKIAKRTALLEVIQRFHLPVHKGYPVISTIEERNALPPGTTYLESNGQYAVQLSRVGARP